MGIPLIQEFRVAPRDRQQSVILAQNPHPAPPTA
jgi:hypothetical protein